MNNFWLAEEYHQSYLAKGGRNGQGQSAEKGCTDPIRCCELTRGGPWTLSGGVEPWAAAAVSAA